MSINTGKLNINGHLMLSQFSAIMGRVFIQDNLEGEADN